MVLCNMKKKYKKTLNLIFKRPVSANIKWKDALALMNEIGGEIEEREGSRVAIILDDCILHQHKPHPSSDMDKGAVSAMRDFLQSLGYAP